MIRLENWMDGSYGGKMQLFGRDVELSKLLELLHNRKTVTLLSGESGIGKSALLDSFSIQVKSSSKVVVAYYDERIALISELDDYSYPIKILLSKLVQGIKESGLLGQDQSNLFTRLRQNVFAYLSREKKQVAESILDQVFSSLNLEQSAVSVLRDLVKIFRNKKLSLEDAEAFGKQRESVLEIFIKLFISISNEFPDIQFILVLDKLERIGKSAIDFLINFVKFLPVNYHVILSYKVGTWESEGEKRVYDETRNKVIYDLGGKEILLEGLREEDIGKFLTLIGLG
jgi:predicted ATPase